MQGAFSAMICGTAGAAVGLPIVFRWHRWLRACSVLVILGIAVFAWLGVRTSHRLAIEKAGLTSWEPEDRFVQGVYATRDIAVQFEVPFWVSVVGLAVLALVPNRPQR